MAGGAVTIERALDVEAEGAIETDLELEFKLELEFDVLTGAFGEGEEERELFGAY